MFPSLEKSASYHQAFIEDQALIISGPWLKLVTVNSYPANWSVEKVKKEAKKDYKYFHGVADLKDI